MKLNQKGFAQVLILIILVAGLGAGLFLVKNPQIFRPRATANPIIFKSSTGATLPVNANDIPQTISPAVKVELISPLGGPKTSSSTGN